MFTTSSGSYSIVKLLTELGAVDLNVVDNDGVTPIFIAAKKGQTLYEQYKLIKSSTFEYILKRYCDHSIHKVINLNSF